MRKVLAITITAAVLFAVGAFAATLANVTGEDIASGDDDIEACASATNVDFDLGTYVAADDDWNVDGATATFNSANCNGFTARIVVEGPGNAVLTEEDATAAVSGGTATFDFTGDGIQVRDVVAISVLVDGRSISGVTFTSN